MLLVKFPGHLFAFGYDIRRKEDWDETITKFDNQIGLQYLRCMHLNDSREGLASKKDRHENIGLGQLGLQAFYHILNDPRVQHIPLIMETQNFDYPQEVWTKEIETLNALTGLVGDEISLISTMDMMISGVRKVVTHASQRSGSERGGKKKEKKESVRKRRGRSKR